MVLREPDADIGWYVLADPEGNEFCAVTPSARPGAGPGRLPALVPRSWIPVSHPSRQ